MDGVPITSSGALTIKTDYRRLDIEVVPPYCWDRNLKVDVVPTVVGEILANKDSLFY